MRSTPITLAILLPLLAGLGHAASVAAADGCGTWPQSVYLLRHAERLNSDADSPLSPAGWQRAGGLPVALGTTSVAAIYVTERQRTQQTAASLAAHTGLVALAIPQRKLDELIDTVCDAGEKGANAVIIVGHSTTVEKIMGKLGVDQASVQALKATPSEIGFGDLYIIDPDSGKVTASRYGDCARNSTTTDQSDEGAR